MTVALTIVAKNEERILARAIESARALADYVYVLDTGSTDRTPELARELGATVADHEWQGFADARTAALKLAQGASWILMLDADQIVEAHPELHAWLDADHDPDVAAWQVRMIEGDIEYRLPRLVRGDQGIDWRYEGATHEWLVDTGRKQRQLHGLTIRHLHDGANRADKHERDIELLRPGVEDGDARSIFYTAEALRRLGQGEAALAMYDRRAAMTGTWEEERWYAAYMAARMRADVNELLAVHRQRPHRHEPLMWAGLILEARGSGDVLFVEKLSAAERETIGA